MYVERLEIRNFRCFEQAEVELNFPGRATGPGSSGPRIPNANLFLGGNGAGKSSVFKAVALAVLAPVIRSSGFNASYLVRRPSVGAVPSTEDIPDPVQAEAEIAATLQLAAVDVEPLPEPATTTRRARIRRKGDFEDLEDVSDSQIGSRIFQNDSPAFFVAGYEANRRTERPEGYSEQSRSPRYQRVASLFEDHVGLAPFTFAHIQMRQRHRLDEARELMNSLLPPEVQLTDQTGPSETPLFDRDGVLLPFEALSDGYRAFVGWVWDLMYQIARLETGASGTGKPSPLSGAPVELLVSQIIQLESQGLRPVYLPESIPYIDRSGSPMSIALNLLRWAESTGRISNLIQSIQKFATSAELKQALDEMSLTIVQFAPHLTEVPGVVIVDEVDLFLHPEWQRTVVEQLATTFPAIQFLFSSHSPLVAGTLEPENLYVLEDAGVARYQENIYGLTPNRVLTSSYFGLRSTRAPYSGTLAAQAGEAVGNLEAMISLEQAEPEDTARVAERQAAEMLEEIGADMGSDLP